MKPILVEGNIRADCPDCGVPCSFEYKEPGGNEFGSVAINQLHQYKETTYSHVIYKLYRCAVCLRAGVAKLHVNNSITAADTQLESFWPTALQIARLPAGVPIGIVNEFREAELCMSVQAWRASVALLRSTLEKTLKINGYNERDLYTKIEAAGNDGIITSARRQRAQDLVRTLGNDVLHEDWREVTQQEVEHAHHYVGRVIEDLYDDRATVETVLTVKGRRLTS